MINAMLRGYDQAAYRFEEIDAPYAVSNTEAVNPQNKINDSKIIRIVVT
jgi:hypothetical protein